MKSKRQKIRMSDADHLPTSSIPTLPVEIIDLIIGHLNAVDDSPTLAVAARANQCLYNAFTTLSFQDYTKLSLSLKRIGVKLDMDILSNNIPSQWKACLAYNPVYISH